MHFVQTQLLKHRVILANIFFLELIYSFYLGRSTTILILRLLFYVNLLTFDASQVALAAAQAETPAAEPSNPSNTTVQAPNYLGTSERTSPRTGTRDAAPAAAAARAARARHGIPPQASGSPPQIPTAPSNDAATSDGFVMPTNEELEERRGSMKRDIVISLVLAGLHHFVTPLVMRGWSWYWVGPSSVWPAPGSHPDAEAQAAAVSSAFMKDYATWYAMIDRSRYFMDFLAADEPPPNLLQVLYRGNSNLPLFLPLLDLFIALLQLMMLKMTLPGHFGLCVVAEDPEDTDAPAPVLSSRPDALANAREGGVPHTGDAKSADPSGPPSGTASGPIAPPAKAAAATGGVPQREEVEAAAFAPTLSRLSSIPAGAGVPSRVCSSGSSENGVSTTASGQTVTARRKHATGGGGGGAEGKVREHESGEVVVDFLGDGSARGGSFGAIGKGEEMEPENGADRAAGDRHSRRARGSGVGIGHWLTSSLRWIALGGGVVSGGGLPPQGSSPRHKPYSFFGYTLAGQQQQQQQQQDENAAEEEGKKGMRRLSVHSAATTTTTGASAAPRVQQRRSFRRVWNTLTCMARTFYRNMKQGWRWELVTIVVPRDQLPRPDTASLITIQR